jgi:hypothetical protein
MNRYGDSQAEVVLNVERIHPGSVYALGGHSSSRQDLERMFFGGEPTAKEKEYFDYLIQISHQSLGPKWITGAAKDRVLDSALARAERLRLIGP